MPGVSVPISVSVPPTLKAAVPAALVVPVGAIGVVVKAIVLAPAAFVELVATKLKLRTLSPVTVKASADTAERGATLMLQVFDPTQAAEMATVPPVLTVNLPKLSAELPVSVSHGCNRLCHNGTRRG